MVRITVIHKTIRDNSNYNIEYILSDNEQLHEIKALEQSTLMRCSRLLILLGLQSAFIQFYSLIIRISIPDNNRTLTWLMRYFLSLLIAVTVNKTVLSVHWKLLECDLYYTVLFKKNLTTGFKFSSFQLHLL